MDSICWIFFYFLPSNILSEIESLLTVREEDVEESTSKCDLDPVNPYFS